MTDCPSLLLTQIRWESQDVLSFELRRSDGGELPGYAAGAHIDVEVPGGLRRSYSLLDLPAARRGPRYRFAVKREPRSRGASAWFHERARVGMTLRVVDLRNDFPLADSVEHALFVAGGIGVTPMLPMLAERTRLGRSWELHYTVATQACAAFVRPLRALEAHSEGRGHLHLHASRELDARLDVPGLLAALPQRVHAYCCGPAGLIDAFLAAAAERPPHTVHIERFASAQDAAAGGFELQLARSGRRIAVAAGSSMLDALLDAGVPMNFSCTQGVCGTCRVGLLAGIPDHRDSCLTQAERDANHVVIACCSGARSPSLTLDL